MLDSRTFSKWYTFRQDNTNRERGESWTYTYSGLGMVEGTSSTSKKTAGRSISTFFLLLHCFTMSEAPSAEANPIPLPFMPSKPRCSASPVCPNFARRGDTICSQCARKPTEEMKLLKEAQKSLQYAHAEQERILLARHAALESLRDLDMKNRAIARQNQQMAECLNSYLSSTLTHYNTRSITSTLPSNLQSFRSIRHHLPPLSLPPNLPHNN